MLANRQVNRLDVTVREGNKHTDWPKIWPIWERIVRAGETHPYDMDATEADAKDLWLRPTGSRIYVAEVNGTVTAAMMTKPHRKGNGGHIANFDLMVDPSCWGHGVGKKLAAFVINASSTHYRAMEAYSVVDVNARALALWTSLGFASLALVPEAFDHPKYGMVGVHIMYRRLNQPLI